MLRRRRSLTICTVAVALLAATGCGDEAAKQEAARQKALEKAEAQVRRIVAELDANTTEAGVYVRVKEEEVDEKDPWNTPLQVSYSQGGVAEVVSVRSAGPDREFFTSDDVVAQGMTANLKGIGEGIKQNTEETAARAARGLVDGAVEGVKESVRDAIKKKTSDSEPDSKDAEGPRD